MALAVWSQSTSPLGKSIYRFVGISAPAQYVPWLSYEAKLNGNGTNTWVRVDTRYPILTTVDGVITETDQFRVYTEFSALQNIIADNERARLFDEHCRFLLANRPGILAGNVTTAPVTPVVPNP